MGLADRLFAIQCWDEEDGELPDKTAEQEMIAVLKTLGCPVERIGWDNYDGSIEIYTPDADWRMSAAVQGVLYDQGFIKAYVNHAGDDAWETHYSFGTAKGFIISNGWRVSYPHKRKDDTGQIWVGALVPSWPKKWFRPLLWWRKPYVLVKPSTK